MRSGVDRVAWKVVFRASEINLVLVTLIVICHVTHLSAKMLISHWRTLGNTAVNDTVVSKEPPT